MAVTLDQAKDHLNIEDDEDNDELMFFLAAANEWVATKVSDTSPTPVQLATLELLRHLWDSQRGPAAGPLDEDTAAGGLAGFGVPNRVRELLEPYGLTSSSKPVGSFPAAQCWPEG